MPGSIEAGTLNDVLALIEPFSFRTRCLHLHLGLSQICVTPQHPNQVPGYQWIVRTAASKSPLHTDERRIQEEQVRSTLCKKR